MRINKLGLMLPFFLREPATEVAVPKRRNREFIRRFRRAYFFVSLFSLISCVCFGFEVQDIKIDSHKYYDNLSILTSEYVKPKVMQFADPPRLVIDYKGGRFSASKLRPAIKSKRIKSVRVGQFTKDIARVVVDLDQPIDYEDTSYFGKNETLVEVRDKVRPSIYAGTKPPPGSEIAEDAWEEKPVAPQIVKIEKVIIKKKAAKVKPKKIPQILKGKVIVVDPGHGGSDPGAFGLYGLVEKNLTLKTAYKLVDYLKQSGATVFLTRKRNIKIDLKEVTAFTNRIKADAYIGIHYNATQYDKINGIETYYYTPQSRRLAEILHRSIREKIKRPDRGVRRARFFTVHHAAMPAVIVEPAYLTNDKEAGLLKSESFLKEVAGGIAAGIKEHFKWQR